MGNITFFRSITGRFTLIGIAVMVVIITSLIVSLWFTRHIKAEAMKINLAGKCRKYNVEMALYLTRAYHETSEKRQEVLAQLNAKIREFEDMLPDIGHYDFAPISLMDDESVAGHRALMDKWDTSLKPFLMRAISEIQAGTGEPSTVAQYASLSDEYANRDLEEFVRHLVWHYETENKRFANILYGLVAFTLFVFAVIIFVVRRMFIQPVKNLAAATGEIADGNFNIKVEIPGSCEIGFLAMKFNAMTDALRSLFDKNQESLKLTSEIMDNVGEGIVIMDREYNILMANKAYAGQIKTPLEEIIGQKCYRTSHHLDKPCDEYEKGEACAVRNVFKTGRPSEALHTHRDKNNEPVYIETAAYPLKDKEGRISGAVEVIKDITERVRMEEQLRQSQKMEVVGQFSSGMAHDFNNILAAILGYAELIKMESAPDNPFKEYTGRIITSARSGAELIQRLLTFSRKQIIQPKQVKLNELIRNSEKTLLRLVREDIELKTFFGDGTDDAMIMADPVSIEQILMNLTVNARDAMPGNGTLVIETSLIQMDDGFIRAHGYGKPGMYIVISVSDTGTGMSEAIQKKIFEPFFTTKEKGQGTGLGLSIVYGIVKQHNGYINVYSEPGKGTTFRISLPVTQGKPAAARTDESDIIKGGSETILFAEDDENLRKLWIQVLNKYGYRVIDAVNGQEAIDKFKSNTGRIDLVILDAIMPQKNGKEVYDEIIKIAPGIKTLFMSGYTDNIIHKNGVVYEGFNFISKPAPFDKLLKKVRGILDG